MSSKQREYVKDFTSLQEHIGLYERLSIVNIQLVRSLLTDG